MTMMTAPPSDSNAPAEPQQSFMRAAFYQAIAILVLAVHAYLGTHIGFIGFIWYVGILLITLFTNRELAFTLLLSSLFLQNAFISFEAPNISEVTPFKALQATSFLGTILVSLGCIPVWLNLRDRMPAENRRLLYWLFLFFGMTAFYSLLGLVSVPFSSVVVYARVYIAGGLMLFIGVAFGLLCPIGYIVNAVRAMAIILVLWGVAEFFFTYDFYGLIHMADYLRLKFLDNANDVVFQTIQDAIDFSRRSYLNLSGQFGLSLDIIRPNGPNMHPISYGYSLTFCALICYMYRSYALMAACIALSLLVGAKGSLIITFVPFALYAYYSWVKNPHLLLIATLALMAAYGSLGFAYGLYTGDFHAIGLLGGIKGFLHNPLGHGIGAGGTLSATGEKQTIGDIQFFQYYGADFGFESAVGVVLYQIGVAIAIFFMFYKRLWQSVWHAALARPHEPRGMMVPIILAILVVNGLFQEEALSPAGWGLWLMYAGLMLGRHWKGALADEPPTAQSVTA